MERALGIAAELGKALLPAAMETAKQLLAAGGKIAGKLGKLGLGALKGKRSKKVLRRRRKFLRLTALASGSVLALSVAGLILSHKK